MHCRRGGYPPWISWKPRPCVTSLTMTLRRGPSVASGKSSRVTSCSIPYELVLQRCKEESLSRARLRGAACQGAESSRHGCCRQRRECGASGSCPLPHLDLLAGGGGVRNGALQLCNVALSQLVRPVRAPLEVSHRPRGGRVERLQRHCALPATKAGGGGETRRIRRTLGAMRVGHCPNICRQPLQAPLASRLTPRLGVAAESRRAWSFVCLQPGFVRCCGRRA